MSVCLSVCMYVCMYVWMHGWMEGRTDGWICGCVDVWMCRCVRVWMYGCMQGWTDGRIDGWVQDVWRSVLFISTWIYIYIYMKRERERERERESYLGDRIATDDMCSFTLSLLSVDTVARNCDLTLNFWVAYVCPWKDGKIGEVRLSQSQTTSAWTILPTSTIENTQGKVFISCSMTKGFILKQAGWKQETKQQLQLISINQLSKEV